jgi:hypothetical protein
VRQAGGSEGNLEEAQVSMPILSLLLIFLCPSSPKDTSLQAQSSPSLL